jgi:hypothetical protein
VREITVEPFKEHFRRRLEGLTSASVLAQAVRRRFDKRIYIPLPDPKARKHMFKVRVPGSLPFKLRSSASHDERSSAEGWGLVAAHFLVTFKIPDIIFEQNTRIELAMSTSLWGSANDNFTFYGCLNFFSSAGFNSG